MHSKCGGETAPCGLSVHQLPSLPICRVQPAGDFADGQILDSEGLPNVGCPVWPGQAYYSVKEPLTGKHKTGKIKGEETALIEQVTIVGGKEPAIKRATIRMRFNRNPVIGELPSVLQNVGLGRCANDLQGRECADTFSMSPQASCAHHIPVVLFHR